MIIPKFLTVQEAAEYLRVSVSTVYNWKSQGRLQGRKHGSRLLFTIEDLNQFGDSEAVLRSPSRFKTIANSARHDDLHFLQKRSLKSRSSGLEGHLLKKEKKDGI